MTKQDIHDIIQLLEAHFDSIGWEVRNELEFLAIYYQDSFLKYDDPDLFIQYNTETNQDDHVGLVEGNLTIKYNNPFTCKENPIKPGKDWGKHGITNVKEILETNIKNDEFHFKTYQYLTQEFNVININQDDKGSIDFTIQDTKTNENIQLKKFNQIK